MKKAEIHLGPNGNPFFFSHGNVDGMPLTFKVYRAPMTDLVMIYPENGYWNEPAVILEPFYDKVEIYELNVDQLTIFNDMDHLVWIGEDILLEGEGRSYDHSKQS